MTSKEALEIIRSVDESISVEQTINECCDIVEKDLEILDILKKSMKETGIKTSDDKVVLKWELFDIKEQKTFNLFNITINNEEDFNKVMEWLEK